MASIGTVVGKSLPLLRIVYTASQKEEVLTENDTPEEARRKIEHNKEIHEARTKLPSVVGGTALATASAARNISTKVSRIGLRGQDIKDQNSIEDKLWNYTMGTATAFTGGLALGGLSGAIGIASIAMISSALNEVVSISVANTQYSYNKAYDLDVSGLGRERQGSMAYNYSRRGAF